MIFIEFIYNLSLLVALSVVSGFVNKRYSKKTKAGLIIQGIIFGVVAVIGMMRPLVLSEGLIFDGRSVVLSLAALFFGPVSGVIAGLIAITFRLYQGGVGIIPGTLVIFFSVLIGSIYNEYRKFRNNNITSLHLFYFGVIVHVVMLLVMFTLPFETAIHVIQQIGIPVILIFPLATVFIGKILSDQEISTSTSELISASEEKYKNLFDNIQDVVCVISPKGNIISANPAFERVSGWSVKERINKTIDDIIYPDDLPGLKMKIMDIFSDKKIDVFEIRIVCKSGEVITVEINPTLLKIGGVTVGALGLIRDITGRIKAEEELKENEKFLKETQKIGQLGSYVLDIESGKWKSSEVLDLIFGITTDFDRSVESWTSIIHPDWRQEMYNYFINEVLGKKAKFDKEYKIVRKSDKAERWVHGLGELAFDQKGQPIRMLGTIKDITDRKNVEEELRKSRDELQDYFENDISADYVSTLEGKIIDCNRTFLEMFNIKDKSKLADINITSLYRDPKVRENLLKDISLRKKVNNFEAEFKTLDNKNITVILMARGVFDDSGKLIRIRGYAVDITQMKLAEEELKKLSSAVEQSPGSVVITNTEGNIEYVNKKFCDVTGYTKEEVIGNNPRLLKSGNQSKEFYENLWNTILKGKEWRGQLENKKKNGELYWESALISPMFNNNGDLTHFIAVKEDITAELENKNKLFESEKRYRELFEKMLDGVYKSTHEGKFIQVNDALVNMLGYNSKEELYDIDIKSQLYFQESDRESAALEEKREEMAIFRLKKKDGSEIWVEDHGRHVLDEKGNILYHEGIMRDVTDRLKMEEELIRAKEKAEEMNRLKNIFLSNMSHELRTPLIGILGYADFLVSELKDENLIEMANVISRSGRRLTKSLNNILDISKIEAEHHKINFKQQDIIGFIKEQINLFKPVAKDRNLSIRMETTGENLIAFVDEEMFISIINNLLSNALKYTEKGEVIVFAEQSNDRAIIEVKDTGIGIPEEFSEIIFEPFRQASEGLTRKYEGTGLGLTLVKKYTELMGGTLTLKSKPGEGSSFTLMFYQDKPVDKELIINKW